jgi:CHAT domain-containing protein/tetratricopeptide (TPR) repeat protein
MPDSKRFALGELTPEQRAAAEAAAVLEPFDAAALATLLGRPADTAVGLLRDASLLHAEGGPPGLAGDIRAALLAALDEQPQRLRELHQQAARHYGAQLARAAGRADIERVYMRHLEQCCEALIQQAPTALAPEADAAPLEALSEPAHRNLVRYYQALGAGLAERLADARRAFERLLAEPALDDVVRARSLNSDATFARMQGEYERARDEYAESYAIWLKLGNPTRQGYALLNQGVLSYYLQDYAAAQRDLLASLELFRAVGASHHEALAYLDLGLVARDQGRWGEAIALSQQAFELFVRDGAPEFAGYASNNIGEVEMLRGHFDLALQYFQKAGEQMTTRAYAVDVAINMGLVRQAQGDDIAALEHYRAALDLAQQLGRREIVALIHYCIGHAEQRLGRLEAAGDAYTTAIAAIEDSRTPMGDEGLLISLMGRWQLVYEAAIGVCLERGVAAAAFEYAERARARAFADILARRRTNDERRTTNDERRTTNDERRTTDDERRTTNDVGTGYLPSLPVTAAEVQSTLAAGELILAYFATGLRGPESALLDAIPASAAGLRACLATPARLLLLALTRDSLQAHVCPLDPNMLQASSPYQADGRRFLSPGVLRRGYSALAAPVAELLAQATRVTIVPHGPLHQLPFAALLDPSGRPLLEQPAELSYAPSTTVLLRTLAEPRQGAPKVCLALGYDGAAGRRLRHTEAEASAVAALCGGIAWRGAAGMAAQLHNVAGDYRWLHLACHGEFDLDDPLRSWLEIGPGERLSAADVLADYALAAELVTLSACRSGVSRVLRGDEPMGLVRAFLSAGARAVLVTLWPVEDTSARLLMECFYRVLCEGLGPAAALRAAQRYLRSLTLADVRQILLAWGEDVGDMPDDEAAQPYADPAFWGAYILIGAGQPS